MDELDELLQELGLSITKNSTPPTSGPPQSLALNISHRDEPGNVSSQIQTSGTESGQKDSEDVYSQLPAPVEAGFMSPGTATRELDSIMNELLGLGLELPDQTQSTHQPQVTQNSNKDATKPEGNKKPSGGDQAAENIAVSKEQDVPAGKNMDAIDSLLGTLSLDMEKMGVRTEAKGHCASCGKCIAGKMITALGKVWHPEHFVCVVCKEELGSGGFFERDGKQYCEADYQSLFSPRCAYCQGPILQNILTAMDRTWHPEHFFCTHCGELFGAEGFMEREGKPYCPKDFYRLFAPKCSGCGESLQDNYLSAANGTWHPNCFVCADCLKPFTDGCFLELDGRPLCSLHFHTRQGMLCGTCSTPILGRCIAALDRKFHPEHFVCAFCLKQLSQGVFKEQGGKPYCAVCHNKLFL
ncbi:hypothetical protein P4O66_022659 [Electrophorus voltai]|uniref:LIM zinc-binding domain-containing protein n=1 Tax=Electrophorus voltai TaxID=2609070 RepID=A0AAD8ZN80_9TELE|nr:hypothetical protein P4O66_022659 [Electrophorus voltai]